jgi:hypothetical protein
MKWVYPPVAVAFLLFLAPGAGAGGVLYATYGIVGSEVGAYNATTGATINANLIPPSLIHSPDGVAVNGGGHLYVSFINAGGPSTIGEYNASTGTAINANLITGAGGSSIAVDGAGHIYAANSDFSIGEYNATTGAVINANLVTTHSLIGAFALDGAGHIYVASGAGGSTTIGEYNATTGAVINGDLVSALPEYSVRSLAVGGGKLYLSEGLIFGNGPDSVTGEYNATTGAAINTQFITSGIDDPYGIALYGGNLYVASLLGEAIGEFNATTGQPVNTKLVDLGSAAEFIAIQPSAVPEPSGLVLSGLSAAAAALRAWTRRRKP